MRHIDTGRKIKTKSEHQQAIAWKRISIRRLLASIKRAKPRKKAHPQTEADNEHFTIARIFGIAIPPTDEQYASIAAPFIKQR